MMCCGSGGVEEYGRWSKDIRDSIALVLSTTFGYELSDLKKC